MTVDAVLDLHSTPRLDGSSNRPAQRRWYWTGDLVGDGWRATWIGRRPSIGPVALTGQFRQSGGVAFNRHAQVRGRVTRVQVRTTPYHHREGGWEPVPGAMSTYRDVDESPRWFDRAGMGDAGSDSSSVFAVETGVMIDLDLDDVDPPEPRPRIEPQAVAAGDHGIWVVDNQLPIIALLSGDTATEYVFPGTITSGRSIRATPTGCTVTEGLDVYRCRIGEPVQKSSTTESFISIGEVTLQWRTLDHGRPRAIVTSPEGEQMAVVDVPDDHLLLGTTTDNASFVIATQDTEVSEQPIRLMRITTAGDLIVGPAMSISARLRRPTHRGKSLFNNPLRYLHGDDVYPINGDLTFGEPIRLPSSPLAAGQTTYAIWISTHASDRHAFNRSAPAERTEPTQVSRRFSWLITFLDADTQPLGSYPTSSPTPSVTTDHEGRHWITDNGLRRLPVEPMTWSDPVDFDAAVTRTIYPTPDPSDSTRIEPLR
ncbi:hypothetical protein [Gordonia westfalica]|nr:hypothetical protein [Gordonia westfalica]